jgi:hypothetical protein
MAILTYVRFIILVDSFVVVFGLVDDHLFFLNLEEKKLPICFQKQKSILIFRLNITKFIFMYLLNKLYIFNKKVCKSITRSCFSFEFLRFSSLDKYIWDQ